MQSAPGLLVVMAHPDDESMGCGGLVLRHTRAGIPVSLICATRGEAGWTGKPIGSKKEDLAQIRTGELEDAAAALAIGGIEVWDYPDGSVTRCDQQEITQRIWEQISKLRPKAVVGWGPDGAYGHPDHIALGACTDLAVNSMTEGDRPALYHLAVDQQTADFYREALRGRSRRSAGPPRGGTAQDGRPRSWNSPPNPCTRPTQCGPGARTRRRDPSRRPPSGAALRSAPRCAA